MDFECPLCNALINIKENCPRCGKQMEDSGRVKDYLDSYSPYLDQDFDTMGQPSNNQCIHLFCCSECGYDSRIIVNDIQV